MANSKSYRGIRFVCVMCISLAALGLGASLIVPFFAGGSLLFNRSDVNLMDVQEEVSKRTGTRKKSKHCATSFPTSTMNVGGKRGSLLAVGSMNWAPLRLRKASSLQK